jgi:hypothetical protein
MLCEILCQHSGTQPGRLCAVQGAHVRHLEQEGYLSVGIYTKEECSAEEGFLILFLITKLKLSNYR